MAEPRLSEREQRGGMRRQAALGMPPPPAYQANITGAGERAGCKNAQEVQWVR